MRDTQVNKLLLQILKHCYRHDASTLPIGLPTGAALEVEQTEHQYDRGHTAFNRVCTPIIIMEDIATRYD